MAGARAVKAQLGARGWRVPSEKPASLGAMLPVQIAAIAWVVVTLLGISGSARAWGSLAILVAVAIGFEEGSRRVARLQIRLSSQLRTDMTSVWAVAGAVALPRGLAVLLLAVVLSYDWFRHQRPAGEALFRKAFVAATALLGCLAAGALTHSLGAVSDGLPWALSGLFSVLGGILTYTAVNRLLVTVYLLTIGARGRSLVGSTHDNLIELATLCLGGLVALAVVYQPWLVLLVVAPMVTLQRGALVRELETAATTDAKTGLLNAIAWEQLSQRELARGIREDSPFAILIIDVDRFKLVNDRFGHLAGDAVLLGIGRCLSSEVREYDTVGRFGGEEFVAALPAADREEALVVAERLRSRVNELRVSTLIGRGDLPPDDEMLAVSIGVACFPVNGVELSDLLSAADNALYRAKAAGRNRVMLAERGAGGFQRLAG